MFGQISKAEKLEIITSYRDKKIDVSKRYSKLLKKKKKTAAENREIKIAKEKDFSEEKQY